MKIAIEIDCTPEEARSFFGLPDLKPLHAALMGKLEKQVLEGAGGLDPALARAWMQMWTPFGGVGAEEWQKILRGERAAAAKAPESGGGASYGSRLSSA